MKTITIRLPDVEAAMLSELQKRSSKYRDIGAMVVDIVRKQYFSKS